MITRWHAPDIESAIHTPGNPCLDPSCSQGHVELETLGEHRRQTWACEHSETLMILSPLTPLVACSVGGHHGEPESWAQCQVDPKCRRKKVQEVQQ